MAELENGQIIKVAKDKDGIVTREVLTKKWTDWIDYWAVDYDFENKKETVRVKNKKGESIPTGTPFALKVRSNVKVVVQHTRLDTTQPALSLMTTMAFAAK